MSISNFAQLTFMGKISYLPVEMAAHMHGQHPVSRFYQTTFSQQIPDHCALSPIFDRVCCKDHWWTTGSSSCSADVCTLPIAISGILVCRQPSDVLVPSPGLGKGLRA